MALRVWLPLNGNLNNYGLSNITITNNGTTVNSAGKIGKCYQFDTNKYIKLMDYAAEFLTYQTFSLSVWFKCTAQNTAHSGSALISSGNWNQSNNLLQFSLGNFSSDHYTKLLISGSGVWSNGYTYDFYLNKWYNVVLTSGNGKMRAYVNGELIGDTYSAFTPASLEQSWICIGNGTYTQVFHFLGFMNDVRIYDHCLSPLEVKEISQGLVLHYKLDDITNGIQDSSGYNHNATSNGSTALTINSDTPCYSGSTSFTSGGRIMTIESSANILPTDMITVNIWFKSSNTANRFISCTESGGWNFENNGGNIRFPLYITGKGYTHCSSNTSWSSLNNDWHMITGTYDRSYSRIYIDGILNTETASSYPNINIGYNANTPLCLGAEAQTIASPIAGTYVGSLSDCRIYCTALSAEDILSLYQKRMAIDNLQNIHSFELSEENRNLLAGIPFTTSYGTHSTNSSLKTDFNDNHELIFSANSTSAGSAYIPINPTGKTYYYDYTISVNAGNQFYIGFERYDANKTSRSNNACVYTFATKPSSDIVHQRYTGIVDLSTDGVNPCAFVSLRILNGWSGTTSGVIGTAIIHNISLREVTTLYNSNLEKTGILHSEEFKEDIKASIYKNSIIEANNFIEQ